MTAGSVLRNNTKITCTIKYIKTLSALANHLHLNKSNLLQSFPSRVTCHYSKVNASEKLFLLDISRENNDAYISAWKQRGWEISFLNITDLPTRKRFHHCPENILGILPFKCCILLKKLFCNFQLCKMQSLDGKDEVCVNLTPLFHRAHTSCWQTSPSLFHFLTNMTQL